MTIFLPYVTLEYAKKFAIENNINVDLNKYKVLANHNFNEEQIEIISHMFTCMPLTILKWSNYKSSHTFDDSVEPLTQEEHGRDSILPIRDPQIYEYYSAIKQSHWTLGDIEFKSEDRTHFENLDESLKKPLSLLLAFFAIADKLINEQLEHVVEPILKTMESKFYLDAQKDQENMHQLTYITQIIMVVSSEAEKNKIIADVRQSNSIRQMGEFIRWFSITKQKISDIFTVMAFTEGIMFQSMFAIIQYFQKLKLVPGITKANEMIMRDENLHAGFWCMLIREKLLYKPDKEFVNNIADEMVLLSKEFIDEALPINLTGLNKDILLNYIKFLTDQLLIKMGFDNMYNISNPLYYLETLGFSQNNRHKFFEIPRSGSYSNIIQAKSLQFKVDEMIKM